MRLLLSIVLGVFILVRGLDLLRPRFEAYPQLAQLVVAEHAIARALLAGLRDARGGTGFDPLAVEREVEHPRQHAKRPVRHHRRLPFPRDRLHQFANVAPPDIHKQPEAELREQILVDDPLLFLPAPMPLLRDLELRLGERAAREAGAGRQRGRVADPLVDGSADRR